MADLQHRDDSTLDCNNINRMQVFSNAILSQSYQFIVQNSKPLVRSKRYSENRTSTFH